MELLRNPVVIMLGIWLGIGIPMYLYASWGARSRPVRRRRY